MAEDQQHVLVADGPEIRAGPVIAIGGEEIVFDEGVHVFPVHEVGGAEEIVGTAGAPTRPGRLGAAGERVVDAALFPDAGVVDAVGRRRGLGHGDDIG